MNVTTLSLLAVAAAAFCGVLCAFAVIWAIGWWLGVRDGD